MSIDPIQGVGIPDKPNKKHLPSFYLRSGVNKSANAMQMRAERIRRKVRGDHHWVKAEKTEILERFKQR